MEEKDNAKEFQFLSTEGMREIENHHSNKALPSGETLC